MDTYHLVGIGHVLPVSPSLHALSGVLECSETRMLHSSCPSTNEWWQDFLHGISRCHNPLCCSPCCAQHAQEAHHPSKDEHEIPL